MANNSTGEHAARSRLARIGITALVDEATGYQKVRDRFALRKMLAEGEVLCLTHNKPERDKMKYDLARITLRNLDGNTGAWRGVMIRPGIAVGLAMVDGTQLLMNSAGVQVCPESQGLRAFWVVDTAANKVIGRHLTAKAALDDAKGRAKASDNFLREQRHAKS
jgi:hypothetical protein